MSELEAVNFMGFVSISSKMVKIRTDFEEGIENEEYLINTSGENTEEWKEETKWPMKCAKN